MKIITALIIGAGQAGLAMSKHLTDRSIEHVLLERGQIANSWKTERWDSLKLLTPNWQSRLPGYRYCGSRPNNFMSMAETVVFLERYADTIDAPVQENTIVESVRKGGRGYIVSTNRGEWQCQFLVLASGACNVANIPKSASLLPPSVEQISPLQYKNPAQLNKGDVLVVGASATGMQLAKEIRASGRNVTLSVGEHIRVPRSYRGYDIKWWMDAIGLLDLAHTEIEDLNRARKLSSLQLAGSTEDEILDINTLSTKGVSIVGRYMGIHNGRGTFSGSLANMCSLADLKLTRLLDTIDTWISQNGAPPGCLQSHRFPSTRIKGDPALRVAFDGTGIRTIIWATGFRPNYSWLNVPVLDRKGNIRHNGGIVDAPGMYALGLPFLRRRNSTLIDGVGADAEFLADHLCSSLMSRAA